MIFYWSVIMAADAIQATFTKRQRFHAGYSGMRTWDQENTCRSCCFVSILGAVSLPAEAHTKVHPNGAV